jgi:hypothetical protein
MTPAISLLKQLLEKIDPYPGPSGVVPRCSFCDVSSWDRHSLDCCYQKAKKLVKRASCASPEKYKHNE